MRHGDELFVLDDGIRVLPKAVEPLGIYDGSRCWGLWVRGQREPGIDTRIEASEDEQARHLVVSPIHPDYWASVFQLEMKLRDDRGALARALKVLTDHDVNILFAECAPSGYRHATLNAVCEISHLRSWILDLLAPKSHARFRDSDLFRSEDRVTKHEHRERQFQEIGVTMMIALAELWARIRIEENELWERRDPNDEDPNAGDYFFYPHIVETGPQPWYLPFSAIREVAAAIANHGAFSSPWDGDEKREPPWRTADLDRTFAELKRRLKDRQHTATRQDFGGGQRLTQEALEMVDLEERNRPWVETLLYRVWRSHWVEPLSMKTLLALSYYRVWSSEKDPIPFRYDAEKGLLKPDEKDAIKAGLAESGFLDYEVPSRALASFYRFDRFVRFRFFRRDYVRERLAIFDFSYEARRETVSAEVQRAEKALTPGLMCTVAEPLARTEFDILRVSNHVTEFTHQRESGQITFTGKVPPDRFASWEEDAPEQVRRSIDALKVERQEALGKSWLQATTRVSRVAESKLFLSMPVEAIRAAEILEIVEQTAKAFGYELDYIKDTVSNSTTEAVKTAIALADVCLQIIVLREQEKRKAVNDLNFIPDFRWLDHEYGAVRQAGIPAVRILDQSIPERLHDRLIRTDQDKWPREFDTHGDLESLKASVAGAITELRQKQRS